MKRDDAATIKIGEMKFPVALLDALRERRLVVFAGAGVSMGKPACLPSFKGLAREIAKGTGQTLGQNVSPDRFLGELFDEGVKVHTLAAMNLSRDNLRHTELHESLLRIFKSATDVRIVTTNFDLLFEQAAQSVFEKPVNVYDSRTQPTEADFNGIVHLHGSVEYPDGMILTDRNFGEAYLTRGWANRFFTDFYYNHTFLFIGYSHSDTIINYLNLALNSPKEQQNHFGLISSSDDSRRWQRLGIQQIEYDEGDDHQALHESVRKLADFVNRSNSDWKDEMNRLARISPKNMDDEEKSYLEYALNDPDYEGDGVKTRFFTQFASSPDWLDWIDERGYLDRLFDNDEWDENINLWSSWLADNFAVSHPDRLQYVVGRREGPLHFLLWERLSDAVKSDDLDENALSRWVSLLLSRAPQRIMGSLKLLSLGQHCVKYGLMFETAHIFDLILKNYIIINRIDLSSIDPDLNYHNTPDIKSDSFADQLWINALKPKIDQFADLLISDLIRRLEERHFTLKGWGITSRYSDMAQGTMGLIESLDPRNQIHGTHTLALCAARDCLDWLIEKRRKDGVYWQGQLAKSESSLLRALAAHSVRMDAGLSPDEKAAWLLEINPLLEVERLNDSAPYRELYRLAEEIYSELDDERRGSLIEAIEKYRFIRPDREPADVEIDERHRYNWYHRLHRSDPECPFAGPAFEEAQRKHPEWKPRIEYGIKIFGDEPSPVSVEQLLERCGSEWVPELVKLFNQSSGGLDRGDWGNSLTEAVKKAARQDFNWSLKLADALAANEEWETRAWIALIHAWRINEQSEDENLNGDQFREALNRLEDSNLHGRKPEIDQAIILTLRSMVTHDGTPFASKLLPKANRIASALWNKSDENCANNLVHYWVYALWFQHNKSDSEISGAEEDWLNAFSEVLRDSTEKGNNGKTALAQQFANLLRLEDAWTIENLLPLFSSRDNAKFEAVWTGLLWPDVHLDEVAANALCDPTLMAVERILPDNKLCSSFIDFYTGMAEGFIEDPLEKWIPKFFNCSSVENRRKFTHKLDELLCHKYLLKKETELRNMWNRWIKQYWKNRLLGVWRPLDENEIGKMFSWPVYFGSVFPEAVELAVQMEPTSAQEAVDARFLSRFSETDLSSNYPEASAKLLIYLGNHSLSPGASMDLHRKGPEIIDNLLTCDLPDDLKRRLKNLCDELQ